MHTPRILLDPPPTPRTGLGRPRDRRLAARLLGPAARHLRSRPAPLGLGAPSPLVVPRSLPARPLSALFFFFFFFLVDIALPLPAPAQEQDPADPRARPRDALGLAAVPRGARCGALMCGPED